MRPPAEPSRLRDSGPRGGARDSDGVPGPASVPGPTFLVGREIATLRTTPTPEESDMRIGVIGLGTMGAPMARNIRRAGFEVVVHNRTREREESLAPLGVRRAESPAALAAEVDLVLVCVSDTPDLEQVLLDPEHGAARGLRPGSLVVDCSTVAPGRTREIAETLRARGVGFVDAPVSGGSEGAERGTLAVMCGGSDEDVARARPVLEAIGRAITHVGPVGAGQIAKAVNQVVISGTYQAVAEGLVLAHRLGADPNRVVDAIRGGAAASWVLENRARNMIEDRYPLGFRVRLHRKDLGIALAEADAAGVPLPVARHVAEVEDGLVAEGHGDEDMSAIARRQRADAGVTGRLDGRG
ncbi:MAG: NAD(P)-dependent oxidoreductase [Planctomycetota bacterium]